MMKTIRRVSSPLLAAALAAAALAGCGTFGIVSPQAGSTVPSPVAISTRWNADLQPSTLKITVDGGDRTSAFNVDTVGRTAVTASPLPLSSGSHSVSIGGNLWYGLYQSYQPTSTSETFTVQGHTTQTVLVAAPAANPGGFSVLDFSSSFTNPTVVAEDPFSGGLCVVGIDGFHAAVGEFGAGPQGSRVQLFDVSNPSSPMPLGVPFATGLSGIDKIAIFGTSVAAAEVGGVGQVALMSFANMASPQVLGTATPNINGPATSIVFLGANVIAVSGNQLSRVARIDFTNPSQPSITYGANTVGWGPLGVDRTGGRLIVGNPGQGQLTVLDGASLASIQTVATGLPSLDYISFSTPTLVASSLNDTRFADVGFLASPPAVSLFDTSTGGQPALAGGVVFAAGKNANSVRVFDLTASPPALLATVTSNGLPNVGSMAASSFNAVPPTGCSQSGGACGASQSCCGGLACSNGACGAPCTTTNGICGVGSLPPCCGGLACGATNSCVSTCSLSGGLCGAGQPACCGSLSCVGGFCTSQCTSSGGFCSSSLPACCAGTTCGPNGTCGPSCASASQRCGAGQLACCGGLSCVGGFCTAQCTSSGGFCNSSLPACCTGTTCGPNGTCGPSCASSGQLCGAGQLACCSGFTCVNGFCAGGCGSNSAPCGYGQLPCCAGLSCGLNNFCQ